MPVDTRAVFPKWMQELRRFQALRSQLYLHGNVYDAYSFPVDYDEAERAEDVQWATFSDLQSLLRLYFRREGYDLICYYDQIDGLDIHSTGQDGPERGGLLSFLAEHSVQAQEYFDGVDIEEVEQDLSNAFSLFRHLVANGERLTACVVNYSSRFTADPTRLEENERTLYLKLAKAAHEAHVFPERQSKRNVLIFICDKLNDVPPWVLGNPLVRGIELQKPDKDERRRFFSVQSSRFHGSDDENAVESAREIFPDLTDGFANRELENLVMLSRHEELPVSDLPAIVDLFKYGVRENYWEQLDMERVRQAEHELTARVKGQDKAVRKAASIIRRAKLGLHDIDQSSSRSGRPKGVLFLAGPTGTGKTELAKALASLVFSDEDAILRFDMSEYNQKNSDVKLIGAPPGYVGYEEGGQLTQKVQSNPFSIILFDEIEKAHPIVFDKFLQILDDGRLTDGKGETVYFTESLIIFTSNLGMYKTNEQGLREANVDHTEDSYKEMSSKIMEEIQKFFNEKLNRPEILNRFGDNFVVFDFIRPPVDRIILEKSLGTIQDNLREEKGIAFEYDDDFVESFLRHFVAEVIGKHGGRGINNKVEAHIKNGIVNFLFEQGTTQDALEGLRFHARIDDAKRDDAGRPSVTFQKR